MPTTVLQQLFFTADGALHTKPGLLVPDCTQSGGTCSEHCATNQIDRNHIVHNQFDDQLCVRCVRQCQPDDGPRNYARNPYHNLIHQACQCLTESDCCVVSGRSAAVLGQAAAEGSGGSVPVEQTTLNHATNNYTDIEVSIAEAGVLGGQVHTQSSPPTECDVSDRLIVYNVISLTDSMTCGRSMEVAVRDVYQRADMGMRIAI